MTFLSAQIGGIHASTDKGIRSLSAQTFPETVETERPMSFKFFPATITDDGRKVPLLRGWQTLASSDAEQLRLWQELYRERLMYWGIPTGPTNDLLVLDVDAKDNGYESLTKLPALPDTMTQATRSGGRHYFFRYPKDGKHYGNRVKFKPGLDIRGVGGFAIYYGVTDKPILEAPSWLLQEIGKEVVQYQAGASTVKVVPEIAEGIIRTSLDVIREAPDGERNNTLNVESFKIGQLVASESITRTYAEQVLYAAAKECGIKDYEAKATITSGLDGGSRKPLTSPFGSAQPVANTPMIPPPPEAPARWTPYIFTRTDLMNTSQLKKPQLFENWSSEDITITTADGGTGKTTLTLYEAICLALGDRFLGFDCKQTGRTLYITGEDTAGKLAAMIGEIVKQMGLSEEKIEIVRNSIFVKKDADLCLIQKDKQNFLHPNRESMRKVLEAVNDIRPKMIIFDPISSFWGSEAALNDMNKAVTRFMSELVEEAGACVHMINHMGKSSSAAMDVTQFAGRGGSGLPSNSRVCRVIHQLSEEKYNELTGEDLHDRQSALYCVVNKFSDGSPLYNKPFIVLREGYLFTRKSLTPAKQKEAEDQLTDIERVFGFVKEARLSNKYPSKSVISGHFMTCGDSLSEARTKRAIDMLVFSGHMGEKLKMIDNPDVTVKEKVYVITDLDGNET